MRLLTFALAMAVAASSNAAEDAYNYNDSPNRVFDTRKNQMSTTDVTWIAVDADKVTETCDRESKRVGLSGFKASVTACTFQYKRKCTIITAKEVTMHLIGHEFMHCFQGQWHLEP